eukprot:1115900-Rhodomonas_salina.1
MRDGEGLRLLGEDSGDLGSDAEKRNPAPDMQPLLGPASELEECAGESGGGQVGQVGARGAGSTVRVGEKAGEHGE